MKKIALITVMLVMMLLSVQVYADDTDSTSEPDTGSEAEAGLPSISGNIIISYSPGTGKFSVKYSGESDLRHTTYTWYKGNSSVSTLEAFKPSSTGSYYCCVTDDSYDGELSSGEITLYQAKGKSEMTFSNEYGLYEKGNLVTARVKLNTGESVTGWTTSVKGVAVPSSGNPVTFTMPAQDITITPTIQKKYSIKISGGTADKYFAFPDETVTIKLNKTKKSFDSWKISGGKLDHPGDKTTYFKMPSSDVTVEATFKDEDKKSSSSSSSTSSSSSMKSSDKPAAAPHADAVNAVYEVLSDGGFQVDVRHAKQGPLCDRAFHLAQGNDWLVTDYFNITINRDYNVYELPSPIRIKLTIPADLQKGGRSWRMLCISRGGVAYSFLDEDNDDATITFSPDRFYAYAMVYNDNGFGSVDAPEEVTTETVTEETTEEQPPNETSASHNIEESQTMTSSAHSIDESKTYSEDIGGGTSGMGSDSLNMDSDKSSAIRAASGTSIPTFQI